MPSVRNHIQFLLNTDPVRIADVRADDTLLDWLRLTRQLTGTKEGCAEGDCGACTVLVGRINQAGELVYESVTACIRFLASLDGCHVVTIEHLTSDDGDLHPLQRAMVDHHGSQCGFCTPGIIMSLYGLWMQSPNPTRAQIETALQGNLCRCTGYRPIIDAAQSVAADPSADPLLQAREQVLGQLRDMADGARVDVGRGTARAYLPAGLEDAMGLYAAHPDATIVAGSTDVGLWVTKHFKDISPAIFIGHLNDLQTIETTADGLKIGAGVSYTDAEAAITAHISGISGYWSRIGGAQVRNMGTIGGNIANGSPIGDTPPPLISLGATVTLAGAGGTRTLPMDAFFIDYGKQDRAPGELVTAITVPPVPANARTAFYKISKRRDEDISALAAGFCVTVADGIVTGARLAFGGLAGTPKRASKAEAALIGQPWSADTVAAAKAALADDFSPLTDWRASAGYRAMTAANLLERFWREDQGETAQLERCP